MMTLDFFSISATNFSIFYCIARMSDSTYEDRTAIDITVPGAVFDLQVMVLNQYPQISCHAVTDQGTIYTYKLTTSDHGCR